MQLKTGVTNMMDDKDFEFWLVILYAIAAISGGMGGCASALYHLKNKNNDHVATKAFMIAYIILGLVFGILTITLLILADRGPADVHQLILFSFGGGVVGSVGLLSTNWTIRAVLRHFGIDVQLTIKPTEDRKDND